MSATHLLAAMFAVPSSVLNYEQGALVFPVPHSLDVIIEGRSFRVLPPETMRGPFGVPAMRLLILSGPRLADGSWTRKVSP
jgi:hypothetical protein